jgi:hypothetical protein
MPGTESERMMADKRVEEMPVYSLDEVKDKLDVAHVLKQRQMYRDTLEAAGYTFAQPDFEDVEIPVPPVNQWAVGMNWLLSNVIGYPEHTQLNTPMEKAGWIEWMWKRLKEKCQKQETQLAAAQERVAELSDALYEAWATLENVWSDGEPEFRAYYTEIPPIIKQCKAALTKGEHDDGR